MPRRVLIISARMGAGHEGASREIARRVEAAGHEAKVVDFLDAFPLVLSTLWRRFYLLQLRHFPESYEKSYQLFYRHPGLWRPFVRFERALAGRRTLRWIDSFGPDVVVSTYSFATLVLGQLKQEGRVTVPTVNFLTDFAVHPRAVHPAIDLNLTVHDEAAALARQLVDAPVVTAGPAVDPKFRAAAGQRSAARGRLGFGEDERVVVVAAGSWGIATALCDTVRALVEDGRFRVVTLCGTDGRLQRQLTREHLGTPVGWTDTVEDYIAAADVVIENAGGLTSLEAFAAGVPVISYRPIPGHGRDNVSVMTRAGVTHAPADIPDLLREVTALTSPDAAVDELTAGTTAMFGDDPVVHILALTSEGRGRSAVA